MIGRLDGRGDFETVLISFRRRVLYKNIGKYQNFKSTFMNLFFVINNSLYVDKSCDCLKILDISGG